MDQATHLHSKQHSNTVKFHHTLVYLGMYTIKLLLTESSVHTGNIGFDAEGAWIIRTNISAFWTLHLVNRTILSIATEVFMTFI